MCAPDCCCCKPTILAGARADCRDIEFQFGDKVWNKAAKEWVLYVKPERDPRHVLTVLPSGYIFTSTLANLSREKPKEKVTKVLKGFVQVYSDDSANFWRYQDTAHPLLATLTYETEE